jgi:hypothetical protein
MDRFRTRFRFPTRPARTRLISGIFSITAASDFLNQLYVKAKE